MTCNYYVTFPDRTDEDRDDLHIGHFIGPSGWTFQGHFRGGEPWLTSWKQWSAFLAEMTAQGGEIRDEYDVEIPLAEFVALVEATSPEGRSKQYRYVSQHPQPYWDRRIGVQPRGDWLDEDGFSFYGGEFS